MLLRPSTRPRATAELGYRILAGVVAGGFTELLGINLARDRNPTKPNYLATSLAAAGVGLAVAILDPPDEPTGPYYYVMHHPRGAFGTGVRQTFTNVNEARAEATRQARMHPGDSVTVEGRGRDGRSYDASVWVDDRDRAQWTVM